jgi:hypothetical protein
VTKIGKELRFKVENGDRGYFLTTETAKFIDYDLIDRIMNSVRIDTVRHQGLYHNLIYKSVPMNLRAQEYNRYLPQYNSKNFNSSKFIWKMLNRTIYREGESTWLRNQNNTSQSSVDKELREYGFS